MRIVNRKEFLKMPEGTVYAKYKNDGNFKGFYIKEESSKFDWCYQDLFQVDLDSFETFIGTEKGLNSSFDLNLKCWSSDSLYYNNCENFVIFEDKDINKIISALQNRGV